jgi:hypothetical protein
MVEPRLVTLPCHLLEETVCDSVTYTSRFLWLDVERGITLSPRATRVMDKALGSKERSDTCILSPQPLEAAVWQASEVEISSQGLTSRSRTPGLAAGLSLFSAGGACLTWPGIPRARSPRRASAPVAADTGMGLAQG